MIQKSISALRSFAVHGLTLLRRHVRLAIAILVVVVAAGAYAFISYGKNGEELYIVDAGTFVQKVSVSGKVEPAESVDMSFEQVGRITRMYARVGDVVKEGSPLVAIASDNVAAQLAAARAEESQRRVERANQQVNLDEIRNQQDTNVASTYRTLLSDDLEAIPQSDSYTVAPPVITGLYAGLAEGTYKFRVEQYVNTNQYLLHTFDLEKVDPISISDTAPTPLGTKGLYIRFSEDLSEYRDTTWLVSVPNIKSATYPANFNAYQQAVRERTRAIEEAQAKLQQRAEGTTIADAMLAVARAEVARLEAELKKYVLRAPFDGTVTRLDIEVGDTASQGVSAVTVMSAGELEIESFVPEIQISYLEVGDTATVTLEAYGESVVFPAHVVAIDPAETVRDGVSTYRVILHFDQEDERVKSGMTANIVITTDQREGVISIPQGAVTKKNGTSYVTVRTDTADERRAVITGPVSSLGMVEILEGLSIGEVVVLP